MKRNWIAIFTGLLLFWPLALAAGSAQVMPIGEAAAVKGSVKQLHTGQVRKQRMQKGSIVMDKDLILTGRGGYALLALRDDSTVEMGEESRLEFLKPYAVNQKGGENRYVISRRDGQKGNEFTVVSDFAIIGVKGTVFTVSDNTSQPFVDLEEGKLKLTAPKGKKFVIRVKDPDTGELVPKKVRSFTLKEGYTAYFDGEKVKILRKDADKNASPVREEEDIRENFDFILHYQPDSTGYHCNVTMGTDVYKLEKISTNTNNGCDFILSGTPPVCVMGASSNRKSSRYLPEGGTRFKAYFEPYDPNQPGDAYYRCQE